MGAPLGRAAAPRALSRASVAGRRFDAPPHRAVALAFLAITIRYAAHSAGAAGCDATGARARRRTAGLAALIAEATAWFQAAVFALRARIANLPELTV